MDPSRSHSPKAVPHYKYVRKLAGNIVILQQFSIKL